MSAADDSNQSGPSLRTRKKKPVTATAVKGEPSDDNATDGDNPAAQPRRKPGRPKKPADLSKSEQNEVELAKKTKQPAAASKADSADKVTTITKPAQRSQLKTKAGPPAPTTAAAPATLKTIAMLDTWAVPKATSNAEAPAGVDGPTSGSSPASSPF